MPNNNEEILRMADYKIHQMLSQMAQYINVVNVKTPRDKSSLIIEDLKYYLFGDGDQEVPCKTNDCGFTHDFNYITWADKNSFLIHCDDDQGIYRITVTKEQK